MVDDGDRPTIGELTRRIQSIHSDSKEDVNELIRRLDGKVSQEMFQFHVDSLREELKREREERKAVQNELQEARKTDRQTNDNRRWQIYAAIIGSVLSFLFALYASAGMP